MIVNKYLTQEFNRKGYAKASFLGNAELEKLRKLYEETKSASGLEGMPFYASIWSKNPSYIRKISSEISKICYSKLNQNFYNFKVVYCNFVVKYPNINSALGAHQDWSFVDETKGNSITLWVPLSKTNKMNGGMRVCPYSHHLRNLIRPRFTNFPLNNSTEQIELANLFEDLEVDSGNALIMNSRLVHCSPKNNSEEPRVAITVVLIPKNLDVEHAVQISEESIEIIENDSNVFFDFSCFDFPKTSKIKKNLSASKIYKPTIENLIEIVTFHKS